MPEFTCAPETLEQLLDHLEADYPTLPTGVLLAAVERYRHLIEWRGDDARTTALVEIAVRYRLDALVATPNTGAERPAEGADRRSRRSPTLP